MSDEYTMGEIVRWLERLDGQLTKIGSDQADARKEQLRWIWGIMSAIVIFGLTTLIRGGG